MVTLKELGLDLLEVEDDIRHVLEYTGNRGEFMLHAVELDGYDARSLQGRQEYPPQGVTDGYTESPLKGLTHEFPIVFGGGFLFNFDTFRPN